MRSFGMTFPETMATDSESSNFEANSDGEGRGCNRNRNVFKIKKKTNRLAGKYICLPEVQPCVSSRGAFSQEGDEISKAQKEAGCEGPAAVASSDPPGILELPDFPFCGCQSLYLEGQLFLASTSSPKACLWLCPLEAQILHQDSCKFFLHPHKVP